jgi:hypothetical protein
MKRLLAFISCALITVFSALAVGTALDINPLYVGIVGVATSFIPLPGGSLFSLLFTAPGGIAAPFAFQVKGLPQFLSWNDVVPLTSLRVETQEDGVLHDWVALSIAACNGYGVLGAQAANIVTMRLGNGFLKDKNVTISGVTSAAGAIGFYGASDCFGTNAFKTTNAAILALEPCTFKDFTAVWVPAMAAVTDTCQVTYKNGHTQLYNINDLAALSSLYQEVPAIMVNNINAYVHTATFACAAAHPAYVLSVKL